MSSIVFFKMFVIIVVLLGIFIYLRHCIKNQKTMLFNGKRLIIKERLCVTNKVQLARISIDDEEYILAIFDNGVQVLTKKTLTETILK